MWWKKVNQSSNQGPPGLTPYALTNQPLPPLLLTVLYFCFINGSLSLIRPKVDMVKIIELYQWNSRIFYECSIISLVLSLAQAKRLGTSSSSHTTTNKSFTYLIRSSSQHFNNSGSKPFLPAAFPEFILDNASQISSKVDGLHTTP